MSTLNTIVKEISSRRKNSKDCWYTYVTEYNGVRIALKGYKTWIQRLEVGTTLIESSAHELTVKELNKWLLEYLTQGTT